MDSFTRIILRRDDDEQESDGKVVNILIALLVLVFVGLVAFALLVVLRRNKRRTQMTNDTLPQYQDVKRTGNHRRLTIQTNNRSSVIVVGNDGKPMLANPQSPPHSPDNVPEIHITFPDEQDDQGRPLSGRVVVVRVGETSVGLEPLHDEQLPAYEKESNSQFYSLDMDKIGGLKEKEFY
jgi:flagellar basal body-associated protein FliL